MQIRSVSELESLNVSYKDALHMPDVFNKSGIYIETSYNINSETDKAYDSKKFDLHDLLQCLYNSINALCTEVTTLRAKVNADNEALSANGTKQGITGYNKLINDFKSENSAQHNAITADCTTKINAIENNIGKNYLYKNQTTEVQRIYGPLTFDSILSGTITNANIAEKAKWN